MDVTGAGLGIIQSNEKFVNHVYDDGFGYLTIGWGHKLQPGESFGTITQQQGDDLLRQDVAIAVNAVNSSVKVPLTQAMFDALVSYAFNWGVGNFKASSTLQYLNSGDYQRAADRMRVYPITSGGQRAGGLVTRRQQEANLFLSQGSPDGSNFHRPANTNRKTSPAPKAPKKQAPSK